MSRRTSLWVAVGLMLVYFGARLVAVSAFPPFLDEAVHVNFGRLVLESGPFARSEEGRQLVIWLYILFGAQANLPLWSERVATLIVLLPGAAAMIGAGRLLSNRWGALFAGLLLILSPYHHFFERLALADPISASAVMLAIYFAARLYRRASYLDAALCGCALFFAYDAKISALPYLSVPIIAAITLRPIRVGLRWAAVALLVGLGIIGAYLCVAFWRGYDPVFLLKTAQGAPVSENIVTNFIITTRTLVGYFGVPAVLALLTAPLALLIRRRFFVPLCLSIPLVVFWLSSRLHTRYIIAPITLLLLCAAVALGDLVKQRRALVAPVLTVITVWGLALWIPFALTAASNPAKLSLPADDYAEYITSDASGFGLAEVIAALRDRQPTRVIGVLANCLSLHDLAPFPVECPRASPDGADVQALSDLLASSRARGTYAVLEAIPYVPDSAPGRLLGVIDAGRPRLSVYDLAP